MIKECNFKHKDGKVEYRNSMEYQAIATRPEFYPLKTLQSVFGKEEGLKMYNERNDKYKIEKVEYD